MTARKCLLLIIVCAAALLRFRLLLQIEHNIDHAYPVWQALMTLDRGMFPLVGQQTSVLFANPPLTGYLVLPFVALIRSPLAPYILVIPLNIMGVLLAYRAMRALVGVDAALIGAALMAVNPWLIEYSRTSWVQSLLPFFVPALTWALIPVLLGTAQHPARRTIIAAIILTALAHTYLLGYVMVIPAALLLIIFRTRIAWRAVAIGAAIFALAACLYGIGLLSQRDQIASRVEHFASQPPRLSSEAWSHAVRLVTGGDYELARGSQAPIQDQPLRRDLSLITHWMLYAALIGGLVIAVFRAIRRRDPRMIIVLIGFLFPVLIMSCVGQVIHPFYQLPGLPMGYALVGLCVVRLFRRNNDPLEPVRSPSLYTGRGIGGGGKHPRLTRTTRPLVNRADGESPSPQAEAVPLAKKPVSALKGLKRTPFVRFLQPTAGGFRIWQYALIAAFLAAHGIVMALNSSRYYEETAYIPGAHGLTALPLEWGMRLGDDIRALLPPNGTVYSELDAPYILSSFAGQALDHVNFSVENVRIIPANGGVRVGMIDDLPRVEPIPRLDPATFNAPPVESDQGIRFVGSRVSQADGTLEIWFQVTERLSDIDQRSFGAFAHMFDSTGARIAVIDGAVIPGYLWRIGDVHRYTLHVTAPTDGVPPYRIGVGLYDPNAQLNAIFITLDGEYTPIIMLPDSF